MRPKKLVSASRWALILAYLTIGRAVAQPQVAAKFENDYVLYEIGTNGANLCFVDKATGTNYVKKGACAVARIAGKYRGATAAAYRNGRLTVTFGATGATATVGVTVRKHCILFEIDSLAGAAADRLICPHVPLTLPSTGDASFAACVLALNLRTNVPEIPGPSSFLRAFAYRKLGIEGAKAAIVACPADALQNVLKETVTAAPELPHSPIGGPWAPEGPINYGSYLFNFSGLTEETADDWIACCRSLGVRQIDFHGGTSFRFGDFEPNPKYYPKGKASLKAVIDKLHRAGIVAGLHTYAQFIDPKSPYVTPVPRPDLGKLETYTLTAAVDEKTTTVPVVESTKNTPTITGFFVRGSVTLQIDDELITYKAVAKEAPFAFSQCRRGAYGTRAAAHAPGAKVRRLRGCFNRFVADGESALYTEVAAKTAELFNDCGFDMIYLDALDGSDAVAGSEWAWYYSSKFTWEIWKRLKRPALMEMSTFHHHLWYVRSRMGAWDHPSRSHKKFVDIHCRANQRWQRSFLPTNLGWWAFKTWHGQQSEPTYPDDIEYLCGKAIANDNSLSIMGINPQTVKTLAVLPRLAAIMRRYEDLRNANYFNADVKAKLRVPGDEFHLEQGDDGEWQFRRVQYARHKVQGLEGWSNAWQTENRFGRQPVKLRIEALYATGPYDAESNITLADFTDPKDFPKRGSKKGVVASIAPSTAQVKVGTRSGCYKTSNPTSTPAGAWSRMGKTFDPTIDLSKYQGLGVWVHGDGKNEVLNLQVESPPHMSSAHGDHYVPIDFTGWRYFELVEIEGERYADYSWPYGGMYQVYRELVRMNAVEKLNLYCNNVPAKGEATCYLSPIKAIPIVKAKVRNPAVTIRGKTIRFPVEIETGYCLEYRSPTDCGLYGPQGEFVAEVTPEGDAPLVEPGANDVTFTCVANGSQRPRAYVSVITEGEALRGRRTREKVRWGSLGSEVEDPRVVTAFDGVRNRWNVTCRSEAHLELELTVDKIGGPSGAYTAPTALPIENFDRLDAFADTPGNEYAKYVVSGDRKGFPTALGVTQKLELYRNGAGKGNACVRYTATSRNAGGWSARGRRFSPLLDLSSCTDIGFRLHGDGKGETLYLQLRDVAGKWFDMKTSVGFTGWKYVEFPLAGAMADLAKIEYLIIYYNSIPAGATVICRLDDVRGLRKTVALANPTVTVNGQTLVFPVSVAAKGRLVYRDGVCKLFAAGAKAGKTVASEGAAPKLRPGRNSFEVSVSGTAPAVFQIRVAVTKAYQR